MYQCILTLSQKGPSTKRITIVPETAVIEEVHTSSVVISSDFWTSLSRGAIENL